MYKKKWKNKKIKSFKKLRRGYKLQNQNAIFLHDLKELLRQFPTEQHKYDDALLIEILNIAESFFIYGKTEDREQIKTECINELMCPYFANDKDLLVKTISHVWQHVSKYNLRRRLWARLKNFFCKQIDDKELLINFFRSLLVDLIFKFIFTKIIQITPLLILL